MTDLPLPCDLADFVRTRPGVIHHPGLLLDRYAAYSDPKFADDPKFTQFTQKEEHQKHIEAVIAANRRAALTNERAMAQGRLDVLAQWHSLIAGLPYLTTWRQATLWRLATHLARASTLENASVSLHPLYGFPMLPGSGLKGLAQAQAHDEEAASASIRRIFGNTEKPFPQSAGNVDFLESWPETWPPLEKDIVNSHHQKYYENEGRDDNAPGDWESPNPTYFLAIPAGVTFRFAVAKRDAATPDADLAAACRWLENGLCLLGAGAKTAAGYGYFGASF